MSESNDVLRENKRLVKKVLKKYYPLGPEKFEEMYASSHYSVNMAKCMEKSIIEHWGRDHRIDDDLSEVLPEGMTKYIMSYTAPASYCNVLKDRLQKWLNDIKDGLNLDDMDEIKYKPIAEDNLIFIVKALHNRSGVGKKELQAETGLSYKQIMNYLEAIDKNKQFNPDGSYKEKKVENRIAGQEVLLDITENIGFRNEKFFFTPNTMHPIFLQENLFQVFLILKALQNTYGNDINSAGYLIAVDIWCQLSSYAKNIIKNKFYLSDTDFHSFIENINDEVDYENDIFELSHNTLFDDEFNENAYYEYVDDASSSRQISYQSEEELMHDLPRMPLRERIAMALKSGKKCSITIIKNGMKTEYPDVVLSEESDGNNHWFKVITGDNIKNGKMKIDGEILYLNW